MKTVIFDKESNQKLPIKFWCDPNSIDETAMEQVKTLANLPYAFKHIAIMPDCHQGYGMPIGSVMATNGIIVPNAVGVDIGCGMRAIRTPLRHIDTVTLKKILSEVRKQVPVGFNKHKNYQDSIFMPYPLTMQGMNEIYPIGSNEYDKALKSLGTLGGGNHFIEFQTGDDGFIWIMIHSGSRNFGLKVATHYHKVAVELNKKYFSSVPKDLAFLPIDTNEGMQYMAEMEYCIKYAYCNRKLMMDRIIDIVTNIYNSSEDLDPLNLLTYDIAHNYAKLENHFGNNVIIHRKGATLASDGTIGIIPGSQGTNSFIVRGKGNKESFNSCSHGAGRILGRKHAIRTLDLECEIKNLNDKGIIHSIRSKDDLQEAPSAYKDINEVMENQSDLVDIVTKLTPIAVIKG